MDIRAVCLPEGTFIWLGSCVNLFLLSMTFGGRWTGRYLVWCLVTFSSVVSELLRCGEVELELPLREAALGRTCHGVLFQHRRASLSTPPWSRRPPLLTLPLVRRADALAQKSTRV